MIANMIFWLVLVLVTIGFGWLLTRAWRDKRWFVKWPGVVLAGLLTLIFALVSIVAIYGIYQFNLQRGSPVTDLKVVGTPDQIARGQHLASSLCVGCHSTNGELPLSGGRDVGVGLPVPLGSFISVNLTPAGPLKDWTDGEILRAIREGVDRDGHSLMVMSTNGIRYLSEEDKQAVIAYLKSQPAIVTPSPNPADQPSLLAAIMTGAGLIQLQPALTSQVIAPPKAMSPEYGKYVAAFEDCRMCHGEDFTGGTSANFPKGPNLNMILGWTQEQFIATIRTGKDPSGHAISDAMPWRDAGRLDDVELGAVYAYLKTLPFK